MKQRVAMNEVSFRAVNEGMRLGPDGAGLSTFTCECGRLGCSELIQLTRDEYEAVRAVPRRFAVAPGHALPEAEDVVEEDERFDVVEKRDEAGAADLVEHTDPRRAGS